MPDSLVSGRRLPTVPGAVMQPLCRAARAVCFWLAVALPMAYLPLFLMAPETLADPSVLVAAVAGNLLALVVGHGHEPSFGSFVGRR